MSGNEDVYNDINAAGDDQHSGESSPGFSLVGFSCEISQRIGICGDNQRQFDGDQYHRRPTPSLQISPSASHDQQQHRMRWTYSAYVETPQELRSAAKTKCR